MATEFVALSVHVRWWLRCYLLAVAWACELTGSDPNAERLGWWLKHGMVIRAQDSE